MIKYANARDKTRNKLYFIIIKIQFCIANKIKGNTVHGSMHDAKGSPALISDWSGGVVVKSNHHRVASKNLCIT